MCLRCFAVFVHFNCSCNCVVSSMSLCLYVCLCVFFSVVLLLRANWGHNHKHTSSSVAIFEWHFLVIYVRSCDVQPEIIFSVYFFFTRIPTLRMLDSNAERAKERERNQLHREEMIINQITRCEWQRHKASYIYIMI